VRQEDGEFWVSLGNIARSCLKTNRKLKETDQQRERDLHRVPNTRSPINVRSVM
jgi:hypothetical protein